MADLPRTQSESPDPTLVTADELRETLKAFNPRPGWKARNIDAPNGRVYDLVDYRDKQAMAKWDWDSGTISAYWDGNEIFDDQDSAMAREAAFRAVETAAATYLTDARRADPYYTEAGRWKQGGSGS